MRKIHHAHIVILCVTTGIKVSFKIIICMHIICCDKSMVSNCMLFGQGQLLEGEERISSLRSPGHGRSFSGRTGQAVIHVLTGEFALAEFSQNNEEEVQNQARGDEKRGDFSVDLKEAIESCQSEKQVWRKRTLVAKTQLGRKGICFQMAVFYLSHLKESGFSDRREFVQVYVLKKHHFFKALLVFFGVFTLKKRCRQVCLKAVACLRSSHSIKVK